MLYANLSLEEDPIIVCTINDFDPSVKDVNEFFENLQSKIDATSGDYVLITVSEYARYISSDARMAITNYSKLLMNKYRDRNKGNLLVTNSTVVRLLFKGLSLLDRNLAQVEIVSSLKEAKVRAQEMLLGK